MKYIDQLINRTIGGKFSVKEHLGYGGMSEVFLARDLVLDMDVALKVIHPHLAQKADVINRLKREVHFLRQLNDSGILKVFDFYESEGYAFLAMEYLSGGDLKNRLQQFGPMPATEVQKVAVQVLTSLGHAHRQGIIHRDLKPHNLISNDEGIFKITDFGLSRSMETLFSDNQLSGTPEYCAPEVINGDFIDIRSDLYSFGVILYEMLTGKVPFSGNTPLQTLRMQVDSEPDIPGEISEKWSQILRKALHKNPDHRYQTCDDVLKDIQADLVIYKKQSMTNEICTICGRPLDNGKWTCPDCESLDFYLSAAESPDDSCSIHITGPGKPGDKLHAELRYQLYKLLSGLGCASKSMEKSVPRLPFLLFSNISSDSADRLQNRLSELGIETEVVKPGDKAARERTSSLTGKKIRALVPRVYMIMMGMMGGLWQFIVRTPQIGIFIFGALFLGVPAALTVLSRRQLAEIKKDRDLMLLQIYSRMDRSVRNPALRSMARRVGQRIIQLSDTLQKDAKLTAEDKKNFSGTLKKCLNQVSSMVLATDEVDQQLKSESDTVLLRSGDQDKTALKQLMNEKLDQKRRNEQLREYLGQNILTFSFRLNEIALRLAGKNLAENRGLINQLDALADDIQIEQAAEETIGLHSGSFE